MNTKELIKILNTKFDRDRTPLRELAAEAMANLPKGRRLGRELRKQIQQPVMYDPGLLIDSAEKANQPECDMIGDLSFLYQIVLNPGVKRGLDFDMKLAQSCGGTVYMCRMWVSLLLPYYATDIFSMTYTPQIDQWEFGPYTPRKKSEKKIILKIHNLMHILGHSPVTKKLGQVKVPKATTDCCNRGKANVFDCLFSDSQDFSSDFLRCTNETPGAYPGSNAGWWERIDNKGRILRKYNWLEFESGDWVTMHLDSKSKVTKVEVTRVIGKKTRKFRLDVEKKLKSERNRKS
jgi:hypothetical protein